MKILSKKASAFIYTIILVNIALFLAYIVLNNSNIIKTTLNISNIDNTINENISKKADITYDLIKKYNSNWWWFVDNISCPNSWDIIVRQLNSSGTLEIVWSIGSNLTYDYGNIYCNFLFESIIWKIFFDNSNFNKIYYWEDSMELIQDSGLITHDNLFPLGQLKFSFIKNPIWDSIDDIMNSDDYRGTSWEIPYPNWYIDDDILPRLWQINKILSWEDEFYNIFWINDKSREIIDKNTNNNYNNDQIVKLTEVTSSKIILDLSASGDLSYDISLVVFNKEDYTNNNTLKVLEEYNWENLNSSFWYLSFDENNNLILSKTDSSNNIDFDFVNKDYAVFIKNKGLSSITSNISVETNTTPKKQVYMNPIDDSKESEIEILSNHLIISWFDYIWDNKIIIKSK